MQALRNGEISGSLLPLQKRTRIQPYTLSSSKAARKMAVDNTSYPYCCNNLFPVSCFTVLLCAGLPHAPCSLPLRFVPQNIPHPKHRMDQFFFKRLVNLITQVVDIDFDNVGGGFEVDIPDFFGNLGF